MNEQPLGIGTLVYHELPDLVRLVESLERNTGVPFQLCIRDNSDDNDKSVLRWFDHKSRTCKNIHLIRDGKNMGCARARNDIWQWFETNSPNTEFLAILDQDMEVRPGWLTDMLEVMSQHPDAGQVIWPLVNLGERTPDAQGRVIECGGGANLHRMSAIRAAQGWNKRFFFYRFDSWFALLSHSLGWYNYVVTKYVEDSDWSTWRARVKLAAASGHPDITNAGILHHHPSRAIRRCPNYTRIQRESRRIYRDLVIQHGLQHIDPFWDPNATN